MTSSIGAVGAQALLGQDPPIALFGTPGNDFVEIKECEGSYQITVNEQVVTVWPEDLERVVIYLVGGEDIVVRSGFTGRSLVDPEQHAVSFEPGAPPDPRACVDGNPAWPTTGT